MREEETQMSEAPKKITATLASAMIVFSFATGTVVAGPSIATASPITAAEADDATQSTVEETEALIRKLPNFPDVTLDNKADIEAAKAAYDSLSDSDKKIIDETIIENGAYDSDQSYGRVLEIAYWALQSFTPQDDSTILPDGTYTESTTPAISSEYSKGLSSSSRNRPWSVKSVTVKDGKATATITVKSTTFTYINIGGKHYDKTNTSGECEFAGVPIDLNGTLYFSGYSIPMKGEIAFKLANTIDENGGAPVLSDLDKVKQLIEALPTDPFAITLDDKAQVNEAKDAYDALSSDDQQTLKDTVLESASQPYARVLEAAEWAIESFTPVDNSTNLKDGTYTGKATAKSDMGLSTSSRKRNWTIDKIVVKDGKATATISRDGNTPLAELHLGGQVYNNISTAGSTFEIPIDLNSTMYFSVKTNGTSEGTNAIVYRFSNAMDETASPDTPKTPDTPNTPTTPTNPSDHNNGGNTTPSYQPSSNQGGSNGGNSGNQSSNSTVARRLKLEGGTSLMYRPTASSTAGSGASAFGAGSTEAMDSAFASDGADESDLTSSDSGLPTDATEESAIEGNVDAMPLKALLVFLLLALAAVIGGILFWRHYKKTEQRWM